MSRPLTLSNEVLLAALNAGHRTIPALAKHFHCTTQLARGNIRRLLKSGHVVMTKPDNGNSPAVYEVVMKSAEQRQEGGE